MTPRSILKRAPDSSSSYSAQSASSYAYQVQVSAALPYPPPPPQVHFPPSPSLTQTYPTHSLADYDRAPIVVSPNVCALPARGCPGRTYEDSSAKQTPRCTKQVSSSSGRHPHPRAAASYPTDSSSNYGYTLPPPPPANRPPPLVSDISSSESDESDGAMSPPEYGNGVASPLILPASSSYPASQEELNKALSFLPYAPPPIQERERERKHRKSGSTTKRRSVSPMKFKSEACARSFAASSLDGCLGGF